MKELVLGLSLFLCVSPSAHANHEGPDARGEALEAARGWLVRHQDPETGLWRASKSVDGCTCAGFGAEGHDTGVTGLAILALLGEPGVYEDEIRAGVTGLIGAQEKGIFGPREALGVLYNQAISIWAICEAMDRVSIDSEECLVAVRKGLSVIASARNRRGGWRYELAPNGDQDTSLTTWCVLALASAQRVGFEVDEEHFQGAYRLFRDFTELDTGRIGYDTVGTASARVTGFNDNHSTKYAEAITAASLHALGKMGMAKPTDKRWRKSFALLEDKPAVWRDDFGGDMYFFMHGAAALQYAYPEGGVDWLKAMQELVMPEQLEKGCSAGSWDPIGPWGYSGGRVYSTSMMIMALEPLLTPSLGLEPVVAAARKLEGAPGPGLLSPEARKSVKRSRKSVGMIEDGLAWLAKHQAEDGYWSDLQILAKCDVGGRLGICEATESEAKLTCTSLALLAFMGEGHYAGQDGPYRKTVDLALSFLLDEYSIAPPNARTSYSSERDHGLSDRAFPALALIEATGGVMDPDLQAFAKRVAESLLTARLADGGWCRGKGLAGVTEQGEFIREQGATTATAMTLVALLRAQALGLIELPEDVLPVALTLSNGLWMADDSRAMCSADFTTPVKFYNETGQVIYRGDAPTSAAILITRLVTGQERELNKECKKHLSNMVPNRKNHEATHDDALAWFLLNIALYPNSKSIAKKWHKGVESALDDFQASKGCAKGSWDFYCFRSPSWGGRVYSTSMAILCLQTPLWGEALFGE